MATLAEEGGRDGGHGGGGGGGRGAVQVVGAEAEVVVGVVDTEEGWAVEVTAAETVAVRAAVAETAVAVAAAGCCWR